MDQSAAIDQIRALAKLAKKEEKEPAKGMDQRPKSRQRRSGGFDLGRFKVDEYLSHYSIPFNIKSDRDRTLYRLDRCLFDPSHSKNEASIIQGEDGRVSYQCFHNSCQGKKWQEARAQISGAEKLARFCENYDPARYKAKPAGSPFDRPKQDPGRLPVLPSPEEVSADWFFEPTKHGAKFVPQFLARYMQECFYPVVWDGAEFYHYNESGAWNPLALARLGQLAEKALGKKAKSACIHDATNLLANRVYRDPEELKHDPDWLNLRNGMMDVNMEDENGEPLKPHAAKYMSRIQLKAAFDPEAKCDRWLQFLDEVFPDEPDKIETLQRYYGYCLLPDCRFQRCLFMIGSGANGKSVAVDILVDVLGEENVCSLPLQLMGERFLIGQLKDKLVNVATEMATNQPIQTANFKDAVAGGLLMADRKHGQPFSFYPIAKHIFSMNEIPKITDKSHGFQRRPVVLIFNQKFEGGNADRKLRKKLAQEIDGIFSWMFAGLAKVLDDEELVIPESVERDTAEFVKSLNPVILFVEDDCVLAEGYRIKPKDLYKRYVGWCEEGGNKPLARNNFYGQISIHFPQVQKRQLGDARARVYDGIGLCTEFGG